MFCLKKKTLINQNLLYHATQKIKNKFVGSHVFHRVKNDGALYHAIRICHSNLVSQYR